MKNLDFKKLLVFLGIIAAIVLVIFLVTKVVNNDGLTDEEKKKVEEQTTTYYTTLTAGYTTVYGGLDVLFQQDQTTFDDLDDFAIIYSAIKYAEQNSLDTGVATTTLEALDNSGTYGNMSDYSVYSGTSIRQAIKELFGDVAYTDVSANNNHNFIYDFYYNSTYDLYLMKSSNANNEIDENQRVEQFIISSAEKDGKVTVTIAVAYVYDNGTDVMYAKDKNGDNIIVENVEKFPEDKIDEFDHFEITLTKNGENYSFENIKKVK